MSNELMNTKEVAEYLGIHEKQVYALIKEKKIPCTRVTGKWVFPRDIIDEWVKSDARRNALLSPGEQAKLRRPLLASGSNDPVLDLLLNSMKHGHHELTIFTSATGSSEGLRLLKSGDVDIAWSHLFDPGTGEYNLPQVAAESGDRKLAVVHLFFRELGLVVAPGKKSQVCGLEDLAGNEVVFINRQKGSGTRIFLDWKLGELGIDHRKIRGYDTEVFTHLEIGLAILAGEATAGIATVAIANLLGLGFIPLKKESFDMILDQQTFFEKWVQAFIATLKSEDFRKKVKPLGDYDFSESGKILYSSQG